jgi:hypothetical protein
MWRCTPPGRARSYGQTCSILILNASEQQISLQLDMGTYFISIVAVLLVNAIHTRLSGRNFLRDSATRLRLATRSIAQWHCYWSHNTKTSNITICMTSIPSRLPLIGVTLKSLLAQTMRPARIRLHIPQWSQREGKPYTIPKWLQGMEAVEIIRCEDCGPATKLLPALADSHSEQLLLVVDDDMIYPPTLVEDHSAIAQKHPDVAICSSGWIVPDDLTDRPTTVFSHLAERAPAPLFSTRVRTPTRVDIMQGFTGYLVRPKFFSAAVRRQLDAPDAAFYVDDVWFSAHCLAPRYVYPLRRICFDRWRAYRFFKSNSLGLLNRGGGDHELRNNTIMIRYFAKRWMNADDDSSRAAIES